MRWSIFPLHPVTHPHILHLTQSTNHPPTRNSLNFQFVLVSRTLIAILSTFIVQGLTNLRYCLTFYDIKVFNSLKKYDSSKSLTLQKFEIISIPWYIWSSKIYLINLKYWEFLKTTSKYSRHNEIKVITKLSLNSTQLKLSLISKLTELQKEYFCPVSRFSTE